MIIKKPIGLMFPVPDSHSSEQPSFPCVPLFQERAQMQRDLTKMQTENIELAAKVSPVHDVPP